MTALIPLILIKRPSSKPSPRKNGSSNTQTTTSLTASTNWTGQSRLFCLGWKLDTTDFTPTSVHVQQIQGWQVWDVPMQHRHHDRRTSTAALSTTWCYEVGHMAGFDASEGQAVWQCGGAQEDSRLREGNRHLHLAYDEEEDSIIFTHMLTTEWHEPSACRTHINMISQQRWRVKTRTIYF